MLTVRNPFAKILTVLSFSGILMLTNCSPSFEGEYSDPNSVEIVDDRWNDADARKTSEILIGSMLKKPWLRNFMQLSKGKKPENMSNKMSHDS